MENLNTKQKIDNKFSKNIKPSININFIDSKNEEKNYFLQKKNKNSDNFLLKFENNIFEKISMSPSQDPKEYGSIFNDQSSNSN